MPGLKTHPRYKVGDTVQVKIGTRMIGTVMEVRGIHSPSGRILYSVHVPMSPEPLVLEVREDEVEKA